MPGYFGENCSQQCPYPSYGIRCQGGFCDCDEDLCDVSTGCKIRTTGTILHPYSTISKITKLLENLAEFY